MEKCYIYRCKLNGVKPAMRVLTTKIGAILNIESRIAFMRNKVEFHDKKWEKKSNVVSIKSMGQGSWVVGVGVGKCRG